MRVTLVKKIKADGQPCRKCADVLDRLERGGLMGRIDRVVVADERDPESEGMRLAAELGVELAPFFVVEKDGGAREVYTSYMKVVKEVLGVRGEAAVEAAEEAKEIAERNPDLDFI